MSKNETGNKDHSKRAHAPFGSSTASRRINCSGSYFLEKDMPEQPASADADLGTEVHECGEWGLADFLHRKIEGEGISEPPPPKLETHKDLVDGYVKHAWENGLKSSITGKSYVIEKELVINRNLGMIGIGDFAAVYSDERGRSVGYVLDYKNGFKIRYPKNDDQLMHLACGLREEVRRGGKDLDYVIGAFYQPRAGEPAYKEHKFTAKALDTWKKKALKAAELIFVHKKAKFKAGDWCGYCRGKAVCETYKKHVQTESALELVNIETVELSTVSQIPKEQIVKMVLNWDKVEAFGKALKAYCFDQCSNGDGIPGLKIVEGNGKRSWVDNESGIVDALTSLGVDKNLLTTSSLIGITETKKLIAKAIKGKKIKDDLTPDGIIDLWTKKSTPQVLVEASDPRPAVKSTKSMLASIEET